MNYSRTKIVIIIILFFRMNFTFVSYSRIIIKNHLYFPDNYLYFLHDNYLDLHNHCFHFHDNYFKYFFVKNTHPPSSRFNNLYIFLYDFHFFCDYYFLFITVAEMRVFHFVFLISCY